MAETASFTISDEGFTVLFEPENVKADIVLVHGLQGNPYATWAYTKATGAAQDTQQQSRLMSRLFGRLSEKSPPEENTTTREASTSTATQDTTKVYWPKDCLAEEEWCKSARILTYGYDTVVTRGYAATNKSNLFAHARSLLYNLERTKPSERPIIFVAHSLGGILVKETLRRSEESKEDNIKDIVRSTKGVIFLGTPHRGSPGLASLGDTVRRVASAVTRIDSTSTILRSLGIDSPELELGRESFIDLWQTYNFRVKTFQEAYGLSGINVGLANEKVVPDTSSSLDDRKEHAEMISANHMDMTKFQGASDDSYKKVSSEIKVMLELCWQEKIHLIPTAAVPPMGYSRASDASTSQDQKELEQELLQSLYFPEIHDRQWDIRKALSQTTDWLFTTSNYKAWIDRTDVARHHGLLWIKGKPGAGKSTLMKAAFLQTQSLLKASRTSTAAFFFNARGTQSLVKTPTGLYMSLLHQVLQQDPHALSRLSKEFELKVRFMRDMRTGNIHGAVKWHQEELQDYLEKALIAPASKPAILFIDAMDECDDTAVQDLVDYFDRLIKEASRLGANLNVCLSSRHYPQISVDGCPEIVVEHHNKQDILRFIGTEAENHSSIQSLNQDIADRCGGVFLWVILVVSILKKSGRGKSLKWLRSKLDEIPPELAILFGQLFSDVEEKELQRTINLIHLILFAYQPLSRAELHLALGFSLHAYPSISAWKDSVEYLETEKAQHEMIVELSKGLLEPTLSRLPIKIKDMMPAPTASYQFVHETVREFFLSGEGFELLKLHTHSVVGSGHDTLASACVRRLNTRGDSFLREPFGQYASMQLYYHIEAAVASGDFGEPILRYLEAQSVSPQQDWLHFPGIPYGADLMYAAVQQQSFHTVMKLHRMGFDINSRCDATDHYPLLVATRRITSLREYDKSAKLVRWLLANGADVNVCNRDGETAIHLASRYGIPNLVKEILRYEPNINARNNRGMTPLHSAIGNNYYSEDILQLLLTNGADVHATDNNGDTPLFSRWLKPGVIRVLVEAGCLLNTKNLQGQTALHTLAANPVWRDSHTPESTAALLNYLVEAGADPTIRDNDGRTAREIVQQYANAT